MHPYNGVNGGSVDDFVRMFSKRILTHLLCILVLRGFGAILGNRYEIQGQKYVALLQGSEITAEFHYRNLGIVF